MEDLSERVAALGAAAVGDPRIERELERFRYRLARIEGKLTRIAKQRSNWTKLGALAVYLDDDA